MSTTLNENCPDPCNESEEDDLQIAVGPLAAYLDFKDHIQQAIDNLE